MICLLSTSRPNCSVNRTRYGKGPGPRGARCLSCTSRARPLAAAVRLPRTLGASKAKLAALGLCTRRAAQPRWPALVLSDVESNRQPGCARSARCLASFVSDRPTLYGSSCGCRTGSGNAAARWVAVDSLPLARVSATFVGRRRLAFAHRAA